MWTLNQRANNVEKMKYMIWGKINTKQEIK